MRIEVLFNSVEIELTRRWSFGEVPSLFANRPVEHLRKVVKSWYHIYHESQCAATAQARIIFGRNPAYPAEALDIPELISSLKQIQQLMNLDALKVYREVHPAEDSAAELLTLITAYYSKLSN